MTPSDEKRDPEPKDKESRAEDDEQFIVPRSVIDELPEETRETVIASYSGPIPPPGMLKGYEKVLQGAADRILTLMELQAKHRRECETLGLQGSIQAHKTGQFMGHLYSLVAVAAATIVALNGQPGMSIVILGTGVAGYIRDVFKFIFRKDDSKD